MVKKLPPPPPIANMDPAFNRWLLELQSILNAQGEIDANVVVGLPDAYVQLGDNTEDINSLFIAVNQIASAVNALSLQYGALSVQVNSIDARVTALEGNVQVFTGTVAPGAGLGKIGDWYGNITGGVGARIYIKTGAATWTPFPF